jgi:DnaJ-class molecular chaperone
MMSGDPYQRLGVKKDASQDEIQAAYRRLAKKLHPDLNPGNPKAEAEFKEVGAAYDVIGDPEKRGRYDRGEIDETGAERPPRQYYRDFAAGENPYGTGAGFADYAADDDFLSELFGRRGRADGRRRGRDVAYALEVDFLDAVNGASKRLGLPGAGDLDVTIPPGTRDGQTLRLRGKGEPGLNGGPDGDALIEVHVRPHKLFVRDGDDIRFEVPISLAEAVLGGRIEVPTPGGRVAATLPKNSNTGKVLRLKGKGVPRRDGSRGDAYMTLKVVLPEAPDDDLERFVSEWTAGKAQDLRRTMEA